MLRSPSKYWPKTLELGPSGEICQIISHCYRDKTFPISVESKINDGLNMQTQLAWMGLNRMTKCAIKKRGAFSVFESCRPRCTNRRPNPLKSRVLPRLVRRARIHRRGFEDEEKEIEVGPREIVSKSWLVWHHRAGTNTIKLFLATTNGAVKNGFWLRFNLHKTQE